MKKYVSVKKRQSFLIKLSRSFDFCYRGVFKTLLNNLDGAFCNHLRCLAGFWIRLFIQYLTTLIIFFTVKYVFTEKKGYTKSNVIDQLDFDPLFVNLSLSRAINFKFLYYGFSKFGTKITICCLGDIRIQFKKIVVGSHLK